MTKTYSFSCYDDEDNCTVSFSYDTKSDSWIGSEGPVWKFFDFLKGCGFVFGNESTIGVMDKDGKFIDADEYS